MNIILLSGGSGKRLWPLSNDVRSKQFLKLFQRSDGEYESMVQRVCRQIYMVSPDAQITITTGSKQRSAILNQLGDSVSICTEPSRRDTFPAIALATAFMKSEKELSEDDVVIICPVDPYTDLDYFKSLKSLEQTAQKGKNKIILMGVAPTYPSEKYGYIIPADTGSVVSDVGEFKEKPTKDLAEQYIQKGALWNCGVFAFKIGYMLEIMKQYIPYSTYSSIYEHYDELPKISFDYAVVEKESAISCITYKGNWKDVGTWNTLAEEMSNPTMGNVILDKTCDNVNVINELNIPLLVMGGKNLIIAASPDGIMVSDKNQSSYIKPYVDTMEQRVMYEEKSWGSFKVIGIETHSLTLRLSIKAGKAMSYHCHHERDEVWTLLSGQGIATIGERRKTVQVGSVVELPAGVMHSIEAVSDLELLEVQLGMINEEDIEKEARNYGSLHN